MTEINIYTKFNYKKIRKNANLYFNNKYIWYNSKTVFAPLNGSYSVFLKKNFIRICYWDERSRSETENFIKSFIKENFEEKTIGLEIKGETNIFNDLNITTITL